jgi:hypothetical protein
LLYNIMLAIFAVSMIVNAVILYRNYVTMRMLMIQLNGFVEQTKMFNEAMDLDRDRHAMVDRATRSIAPE